LAEPLPALQWQPGYVYPPVFNPPHYHLGPLHALFFLAIAIAVGYITHRRPALGIGAMIVCLPFAEARYMLGTSITIPKAAFIGFVIALLLQRPSLRIFNDRVVRIALAAFGCVLVTIALSAISAQHHGQVARELAKWIEYGITFVAAAVAFDNDPDDRPIWRALIGIAIFESLYAVAQLFIGAPSGVVVRGHIWPRVAGSLEGPNQFAGWLNLIFPVLFARMLLHRDVWLVAATVLSAIAMVLTLSRAGIVAGFVGAIVVLVLLRPPKRIGVRLATGVAILAVALVGIGLMSGLEARFFSLAEVATPNHLGTRSILWTAALDLWQRSPIVGIGAGNYELDLGLVGYPDVHTHANSLYLQSLAETGILGLAAVLFLIWQSIVPFVQRYSRRALVIGVAAANIAFALHQIFDYMWFYPKVGGVWCLLFGIGIVELLASRDDVGVLPQS
jgi:O-antigen ligase